MYIFIILSTVLGSVPFSTCCFAQLSLYITSYVPPPPLIRAGVKNPRGLGGGGATRQGTTG